ncbi:hypothetical protein [Palleronia sp. LCG004]|uniref:hypothetical protein n=1 Tax=Palleronia sp. LCG004 TaxID=3079304 RepID=UPI0029428112|nr:hypothetical protein [Palleronia sp. LCG004]WOI57863.1 hypothetical protein RVY76_14730 [Palleronia sp. LCG004]
MTDRGRMGGDRIAAPLTGLAEGTAFEDILDGYFTLRESVRQMMVRNGFGQAVFTLHHAPLIEVPGLAETAAVPLHLRPAHSGLVTRLSLTVTLQPDLRLQGAGLWSWTDPRPDPGLPADIRLGEPAFIAGTGWTEPGLWFSA